MNTLPTTLLILCILSFFSSSIYGQDCEQALAQGVRDSFFNSSDKEMEQAFASALSDENYVHNGSSTNASGGLKIPLGEMLNFGAEGAYGANQISDIRRKMNQGGSSHLSTSDKFILASTIANKDILNSYNECLDQQVGLVLKPVRNTSSRVSFECRWIGRNGAPFTVKVQSLQINGSPKNLSNIQTGASLSNDYLHESIARDHNSSDYEIILTVDLGNGAKTSKILYIPPIIERIEKPKIDKDPCDELISGNYSKCTECINYKLNKMDNLNGLDGMRLEAMCRDLKVTIQMGDKNAIDAQIRNIVSYKGNPPPHR